MKHFLKLLPINFSTYTTHIRIPTKANGIFRILKIGNSKFSGTVKQKTYNSILHIAKLPAYFSPRLAPSIFSLVSAITTLLRICCKNTSILPAENEKIFASFGSHFFWRIFASPKNELVFAPADVDCKSPEEGRPSCRTEIGKGEARIGSSTERRIAFGELIK